MGWHEHDHRLFSGTEAFFRPGYEANLVSAWIPALDGVEEELRAGGKVADVGCGHGASTIILAEAFPASMFRGVDYHAASTFLCTPNSLSQEVGTALGAQAGEARLRAILEEAGFRRVRRATETPFNLILEARP